MQVGIFIPVYFREELVKKCLISLMRSNFDEISVFLCIGINGASKDFKQNFLREYIKRCDDYSIFEFIKVFDFNQNIGKPKMVNTMTVECPDFDYMVSMDSDMQVVDPHWLPKFLDVFYTYSTKYRTEELGALCANQVGQNVHLTDKLEKLSRKVNKQYTITTTHNNEGVAGGVLIVPLELWKKIGGYSGVNIFGADDGPFMYSCHQLKKIVAYVEEINFYHPPSPDDDYHKWKVKSCKNELDDKESGFFENLRGK